MARAGCATVVLCAALEPATRCLRVSPRCTAAFSPAPRSAAPSPPSNPLPCQRTEGLALFTATGFGAPAMIRCYHTIVAAMVAPLRVSPTIAPAQSVLQKDARSLLRNVRAGSLPTKQTSAAAHAVHRSARMVVRPTRHNHPRVRRVCAAHTRCGRGTARLQSPARRGDDAHPNLRGRSGGQR